MVGLRLRQLTYGLCRGPFRETHARSGATSSNQIPRHEGGLPPEIGGIERRAGGRDDAGRFKIRFERNRFCVTASASKTCMVRTAPRCKRHRGREIVLDAKEHQSGEINYTGRISKIGEPMTIIPFSSRFSS